MPLLSSHPFPEVSTPPSLPPRRSQVSSTAGRSSFRCPNAASSGAPPPSTISLASRCRPLRAALLPSPSLSPERRRRAPPSCARRRHLRLCLGVIHPFFLSLAIPLFYFTSTTIFFHAPELQLCCVPWKKTIYSTFYLVFASSFVHTNVIHSKNRTLTCKVQIR